MDGDGGECGPQLPALPAHLPHQLPGRRPHQTHRHAPGEQQDLSNTAPSGHSGNFTTAAGQARNGKDHLWEKDPGCSSLLKQLYSVLPSTLYVPLGYLSHILKPDILFSLLGHSADEMGVLLKGDLA